MLSPSSPAKQGGDNPIPVSRKSLIDKPVQHTAFKDMSLSTVTNASNDRNDPYLRFADATKVKTRAKHKSSTQTSFKAAVHYEKACGPNCGVRLPLAVSALRDNIDLAIAGIVRAESPGQKPRLVCKIRLSVAIESANTSSQFFRIIDAISRYGRHLARHEPLRLEVQHPTDSREVVHPFLGMEVRYGRSPYEAPACTMPSPLFGIHWQGGKQQLLQQD